MARKLHYKILDDGTNAISDQQWEEVLRLQHWYNSEFMWTAGRLTFKMYAVFQNPDALDVDEDTLWKRISARRAQLTSEGLRENEIVRRLEQEGLIIAKKGGYEDNCLASGFTRVANNEWNAYLVCDFLLKASTILPHCVIIVNDDGAFIKTRQVQFLNGAAQVLPANETEQLRCEAIVDSRHIFSIVDPAKYDNVPAFTTSVTGFNALEQDEKRQIVSDWNWLGFEQNFDRDGDDIQGMDLNKKVVKFKLVS